MADPTLIDGRGVAGGAAQAVVIMNQTLPGSSSTPTGAATEAKQDTQITKLTSIDGKTPALGQALAAASSPVVLTAIQAAALAAPVVSGTVEIGATTLAALETTTSLDGGPGWTTSQTRTASADMSTAADISVAPTSGQKLVITDVLISTDTAMRFDLLEESNATPKASFYLPANGSYQFTPRGKFKLPTADKKLQGKATVAGNVSVTALYFSEV